MIQWPQPLIEKIARRNVVILIGSGVSANSADEQGTHPPTWYSFLQQAKESLNSCPSHVTRALNQYRYLEACEYLKELHDDNWIELIKNSFYRPAYKPAAIHHHIFNLDSRIVCSLNFDRIYDTHAISKSDGTYIVKNYWDDDIASITSGPERYLIKLHGSVEHADKLIFSTSDYASARNKFLPFYSVLDALLVTHSFLILGCGLNDPDIQLIFENYRYRFNLKNHYMCLPKPIHQMEKKLTKDTRGINIIPYNSQDNHAELTSSIAELVDLVATRRDGLAKDQSW